MPKPTPSDIDQKIAKLPLWAQDFIGRVERERDDAQEELSRLKGGSLENIEKQHFYVDNFRSEPFWLPQYGRLGFKEDPEREGSPDLDIRESGHPNLGGIEVRSTLGSQIVAVPAASNSIIITKLKR